MPQLYVVCGPAGVGKSTYGKALAAEKKACFLDSDTATEPVVRAGMELGGFDPNDRDSEVYRAAFRAAVYECLFQTAAENLPHLSVVLVGPFTSEIRKAEWPDELAERFSCELEVIFVTCPEDERYRRIKARKNPRDDLKLADWEGYLKGTDLRPPAFEYREITT